jgi:pimeloyl-ACP methyl ester carboxylesterase
LLTEQTFDTGVVAINYAEGPRSGPPLVLLHGVGSRWQVFLTMMPVLTQRWHVVAADLRGHGRSGRVPGRYGVMDYAGDVIALIRHLDEGPAVVLGHSLGAMVAIGVAAEAPNLVRAVVLEDPPLGAFGRLPFTERPEHARFVATRDMARAGHSFDELVRLLTLEMSGQDGVRIRARAGSVSQIDADVFTLIIENRAIDDYDLADRLRRIGCPTLLVQGNEALGGALADDEADWAASLLRQGILVRMPEVGHQIHADPGAASVRFRQLVTDFLETV